MLKTLLPLSGIYLGKIANKENNEVVRSENGSTAFLFKKSKNAKF